jgi:hypothetical protein
MIRHALLEVFVCAFVCLELAEDLVSVPRHRTRSFFFFFFGNLKPDLTFSFLVPFGGSFFFFLFPFSFFDFILKKEKKRKESRNHFILKKIRGELITKNLRALKELRQVRFFFGL